MAESTGSPADVTTLKLGAIPGATPGKWIARWREQHPREPIELVPLEVPDQLRAIRAGDVDMAICRGPIAQDDLHRVALYDEDAVVAMSADSHLTVADDLEPEDLAGEVLLTPLDDVIGPLDLPTVAPSFDPVPTTVDAIATVATGVGITIVPMSLARLHHRKDVTFRRLLAVPASPVVLAWLRERDADDIQAFVGITRGRTSRSSR